MTHYPQARHPELVSGSLLNENIARKHAAWMVLKLNKVKMRGAYEYAPNL